MLKLCACCPKLNVEHHIEVKASNLDITQVRQKYEIIGFISKNRQMTDG